MQFLTFSASLVSSSCISCIPSLECFERRKESAEYSSNGLSLCKQRVSSHRVALEIKRDTLASLFGQIFDVFLLSLQVLNSLWVICFCDLFSSYLHFVSLNPFLECLSYILLPRRWSAWKFQCEDMTSVHSNLSMNERGWEEENNSVVHICLFTNDFLFSLFHDKQNSRPTGHFNPSVGRSHSSRRSLFYSVCHSFFRKRVAFSLSLAKKWWSHNLPQGFSTKEQSWSQSVSSSSHDTLLLLLCLSYTHVFLKGNDFVVVLSVRERNEGKDLGFRAEACNSRRRVSFKDKAL